MSCTNLRNLMRENDFTTADGLHTSFEGVYTSEIKISRVTKYGSTFVDTLITITAEYGVLKTRIPSMKDRYTP
jgi:hypothetical protein